MEGVVETNYCNNCKRDIPIGNFVIHTTHCHRRIKLCHKCNDPVPIESFDSHNEEFHSSVTCPECDEVVENNLDQHKADKCPKRKVCCEYCELEVTADDLNQHTDYCGSRTERCEGCGRIIMFKDKQAHLDNNHVLINNGESSPSGSTMSIPALGSLNRQRNTQYAVRDFDGYRSQFDDYAFYNYQSPFSVHFPDSTMSDGRLTERVRRLSIDGHNGLPYSDIPRSTRDDNESLINNPTDHDDDDTPIPCEFCNALVPARLFVLHGTGCTYAPANLSNSATNVNTAQDTGPSPNDYHHTDRNDLQNNSEDIGLPCQFCFHLYSLEELMSHQESCLDSQIAHLNSFSPSAERSGITAQPSSPVGSLNEEPGEDYDWDDTNADYTGYSGVREQNSTSEIDRTRENNAARRTNNVNDDRLYTDDTTTTTTSATVLRDRNTKRRNTENSEPTRLSRNNNDDFIRLRQHATLVRNRLDLERSNDLNRTRSRNRNSSSDNNSDNRRNRFDNGWWFDRNTEMSNRNDEGSLLERSNRSSDQELWNNSSTDNNVLRRNRRYEERPFTSDNGLINYINSDGLMVNRSRYDDTEFTSQPGQEHLSNVNSPSVSDNTSRRNRRSKQSRYDNTDFTSGENQPGQENPSDVNGPSVSDNTSRRNRRSRQSFREFDAGDLD